MIDFVRSIRDYVGRHAAQPLAKKVIDEAEKLLANGVPDFGGDATPLSNLLNDVREDVQDVIADIAALKEKTLTVAQVLETVRDLVRTVEDLKKEIEALKLARKKN